MKKIIIFTIIMILVNGCSDNEKNTSEPDYRVTPSEVPKNISLKEDENIIVGDACTIATIYNSYGDEIGTTDVFAYIYGNSSPIPAPLAKGEYRVSITERYSGYTNSKDILYYVSSNIKINNLPLNKTIIVPNQTADIYKLTIYETSSYILDTNSVIVELYDSELNKIGTTLAFSVVYGGVDSIDGLLTINSGTYYLVSKPYNCKKDGGSFLISPI